MKRSFLTALVATALLSISGGSALSADAAGATDRGERQWLMMVRTVNTDAAREAQFNDWYDRIDIPDVLAVSGYWRARRGQSLPNALGTAAVPPGEAGHYVALYNIGSPAIDKTIIDMLMASWQMDRLGHSTDLLKVVERVYFGQYSAPFTPPSGRTHGGKHFLFLERFDVAQGRAVGRFNAWYDRSYRQAAASVPGVVVATRYELYRVLMFEPQSAPRFLTVYEIEADSSEAAHRAANELTQADESARTRAGYVAGGSTLYAELKDLQRP